MVEIGQAAPNFTLTDTTLQPLQLSDFKGKKVVLLFFPLAFSSGCTKEMCLMRDDYRVYQNLDAVVLGISVDSPFVLRQFKEAYQLDFPLLSDFNRMATQAYGVSFEGEFVGITGFSRRASFVLNTEEVICYAEIAVNGMMPNFAAIQNALAK